MEIDMAREHSSKILNALLAGGALILPSIAEAASFPPELIGKSVTVTWTTKLQGKFEGVRSMDVSLRIYASTAEQTRANESVTVEGPGGYKGSSKNNQDRGILVEGAALLADSLHFSGAWRVSITFDAGYGNCDARVIFNREGDAGPIRMRSLLDKMMGGQGFEVLSTESSTPVCSVTSGNVLGTE
jgi:hypothetical protein